MRETENGMGSAELEGLANDLWDVLYFNPDRLLKSSGTVFWVENMADACGLEFLEACALYIKSEDLTQIRWCRPLIEKIDSAIVLIRDRGKRKTISDLLSSFFPQLRQFLPDDRAFGPFQSVRDLIDTGGNKALDKLIMSVAEKPAVGLLDISDVRPPKNRISTLSGIPDIDKTTGGFYGGELSIWTGTRGSGKSTILSEILLESIDQGRNVCAYSGELPAWRFKQWTMLQAAGPRWIVKQENERSKREYFTVRKESVRKIEEWWRGRFFLYDNNISTANDEDSILSIFELAHRRYGCTMFLCDNLMTARFRASRDSDFYRAQSNFTGRLVEFTKKNNVHIHLVAHPRKLNNRGGRPEADDVGGSGDITNRADNVFSMSKLSEENREKEGCDTSLEILKNREYGTTAKVKLSFDAGSRRFYKTGSSPDKRYSWDDGTVLRGPGDIDSELP